MDQKLHKVYLIIGTNLGNKPANLDQAIATIEKNIGDIAASSSIYETEPWGIVNQPGFYNQVLQLYTSLTPIDLLNTTLEIEKEMGRVRALKYGARIIDIDILFFDDLVLDSPRLTLPHPRIAERNFVLAPLAEIAPCMIHQVLNQTISRLLEQSNDKLSVKRLPPREK